VACAGGTEDGVPSPEQIMKSEEGTQLSIEGV
jgi:hypothetical protein